MSEHYPRFRHSVPFEGAEHLWIRECVRISFYMRHNHPEVVQAVMRALEVFLRVLGPQTLGWYADDEGEWQPLDDRGRAFIQDEFLTPTGANVYLCKDADSMTGYEFTYRGRLVDLSPPHGGPNDTCEVTFWLPTESLEEQGPSRVRELALELAAGLPFNSGHAGLCYLFPDGLLGITKPIRKVCFRYPGIDLNDTSLCSELGDRVQGVHWLNFLGPPVLQALGGAEGLRAQLRSPSTTVQALDAERAVVTLGLWPEAGDLEQGRTLPEYRELARVLEPWLQMRRSAWHSFSSEDMRHWQRRFLD